LVIESNGVQSAPMTLPVEPAVPGVFVLDMSGRGQAVVLNENGTLNLAANAAARGSTVHLFATGLAPSGVTVQIGGVSAEVLESSGTDGVYQVVARVPATAATGAAVPLTVAVGSAASQPGVTLAIQ
jgi:uncharacterized protein (TIGR03437 family)